MQRRLCFNYSDQTPIEYRTQGSKPTEAFDGTMLPMTAHEFGRSAARGSKATSLSSLESSSIGHVTRILDCGGQGKSEAVTRASRCFAPWRVRRAEREKITDLTSAHTP